jgi:EAL domain-containing protein (putative c-di-GMP-specific phosphodiesterase class I)
VRNVDRLTDSQAIVSSMLQMAASLGIGTVAEGVERIEEARWLRDHGCDAVQGYLLGRPATADRLDLARSGALDPPA